MMNVLLMCVVMLSVVAPNIDLIIEVVYVEAAVVFLDKI
jgi:hypothetical protein